MSSSLVKPIIDVDEPLPEAYLIKNCGDYLFHIYLTPKTISFDENTPKESKYHRRLRYFIMFTYVVLIIRSITIIASINQSHDTKFFAILIGDFTYWIPSVRIHFNVMLLLFSTICLIAQILLRKSSYSSWLDPFVMMSGRLTPRQLGFGNQDTLIKFLKKYEFTIN
jgi:hypothetical protein